MMTRIPGFTLAGALCGGALLLTSCGNVADAPADGEINIAPASIAWEVSYPNGGSPPACDGSSIQIHKVTISVLDADGQPVGNADIGVTLQLSGNTSASLGGGLFGAGVTLLWDDFDDSGGITDSTGNWQINEFVSGLVDPQEYRTQTDEFGTKTLWLTVDITGCPYRSLLNVFSGTLYQQISIEITAVEAV